MKSTLIVALPSLLQVVASGVVDPDDLSLLQTAVVKQDIRFTALKEEHEEVIDSPSADCVAAKATLQAATLAKKKACKKGKNKKCKKARKPFRAAKIAARKACKKPSGALQDGKCHGTEDISEGTSETESPCLDAETGFGPDFTCKLTDMWCGDDSGDGLVVGQCCPKRCKAECENKNKNKNAERLRKAERERKKKRAENEESRKKAERERKKKRKETEWTEKRNARKERNEKAEDERKSKKKWDEKKRKKERSWKQGLSERKRKADKREAARKEKSSKSGNPTKSTTTTTTTTTTTKSHPSNWGGPMKPCMGAVQRAGFPHPNPMFLEKDPDLLKYWNAGRAGESDPKWQDRIRDVAWNMAPISYDILPAMGGGLTKEGIFDSSSFLKGKTFTVDHVKSPSPELCLEKALKSFDCRMMKSVVWVAESKTGSPGSCYCVPGTQSYTCPPYSNNIPERGCDVYYNDTDSNGHAAGHEKGTNNVLWSVSCALPSQPNETMYSEIGNNGIDYGLRYPCSGSGGNWKVAIQDHRHEAVYVGKFAGSGPTGRMQCADASWTHEKCRTTATRLSMGPAGECYCAWGPILPVQIMAAQNIPPFNSTQDAVTKARITTGWKTCGYPRKLMKDGEGTSYEGKMAQTF